MINSKYIENLSTLQNCKVCGHRLQKYHLFYRCNNSFLILDSNNSHIKYEIFHYYFDLFSNKEYVNLSNNTIRLMLDFESNQIIFYKFIKDNKIFFWEKVKLNNKLPLNDSLLFSESSYELFSDKLSKIMVFL